MSIGFYDENAEDFFQRSASADMAPAYDDFLRHVPPGGRILDAGCGSGRDALAFHRRGFRVTAMEAAPNLAELARTYTGLPVEVMTFADVAWREQFDGVWAGASLLHVPAADLPHAVGRLRDALKRGGVFWMSFKYGRAERDANGRRFTDLDEAAGRALVVETGGLDLLSVKITEDVRQDRPGERWLSLLAKRM